MMEIEQLWREIDGRVGRLGAARVGLLEALGRVVAEDVLSPVDLPAFDQSAMDGFAFASITPGVCRIVATVAAGGKKSEEVGAGRAVRILTGAPVPSGTVAVARQEDCEREGDSVFLLPGVCLAPGDNIRLCGGVYSSGDLLVKAGERISSGIVALLSSAGIGVVGAVCRASVRHLVTGDEIVPPGEALTPGGTHDSNGPMLSALLAENGLEGERVYLGDNAGELARQVGDFAGDLLLISGGSGPGDRDHTLSALHAAGYSVHAARLNSRPGKPLIFATRGRQVVFGLPGNPLSHWVCFQAFVRRAICRFHGLPVPEMQPVRLGAKIDLSGDGRRTWTPGFCRPGENGLEVFPLPWKHSGDLTPLATANALLLGTNGEALIL